MAVISINRKQYEREVGKLDEKMQQKIAMFGTPIEKLTVDELQVEVSPNRPDLLSYQGFKRAMLTFLDKKTGLKSYKLNKPRKGYKVKIDPSLKDIRPYTACAIVNHLKLDSNKIKELIEIQEKLHITIGRKRKKVAIGIYPLEKIKLPIAFKALEPDKIKFTPLEANKEMSGLEILQKHPTGKEYAPLLSGKTKFPVFVDATNKILSMPPIINSHETGKVTERTKSVFIECSGSDFAVLKKCLNILVTVLADMGGKIHKVELDYGKKEITPDLTPERKKISIQNTNKLLGIELTEKKVKKLLEKMGHDYNKGNVKIPAWRTDVLHEVDLIEDVAIAYGYDNFEPEIPGISTIGQENPRETKKRQIANILSGLNMLEVSNYHLTTLKDQIEKMGLRERASKTFVELEESKTDYNILRNNLSAYLLKVYSENTDEEYPQQVFEIGKVFSLSNGEVNEHENLAVAISPGNFTKIKQILEYLSEMIDLKIELKEPKEVLSHLIKERTAEITFQGKNIGFIGEIHPKILRNWKIKMPIALFEISLEKIYEKLN